MNSQNERARLLTADEIRQLPWTSIVWIEYYDAEIKKSTSLLPSMKCLDGRLVCEDCCEFYGFEMDMKPCGDGWWRFWSAKPTPEQREEVPWE